MQVDLDVMTKEPTQVNNEDIEFVLEIGDMQSVISQNYNSTNNYNLNPVQKHISPLLGKMYTTYERVKGTKRVKLSEYTEEHYFIETEEVIYDQDDFVEFIETKAKVNIKVDSSDMARSYTTALPKRQDINLFKEINQQLRELCREYDRSIDEIHTLWMEA